MAIKRSAQIDLSVTPFYHCCTRTVRKALLLKNTKPTEIDRRKWIEDRILFLASVFAIDVAAYAVMSNHYHAVLNVKRNIAINWSRDEVLRRWHLIYKGTELTRSYLKGDILDDLQAQIVDEFAEICRPKLYDISYFMRNINEPLARIANKEDQCSGRFWESRFKSQALLDEKALLTCMAYVDLNPIRANIDSDLKTSSHTSIKKRIIKASISLSPNHPEQQCNSLSKFTGSVGDLKFNDIPIRLTSYLELVEWTGRNIKKEEKGCINPETPHILSELNIDPAEFINTSLYFESRFHRMIGSLANMKRAAVHFKLSKSAGMKQAMLLFG